MRIHKDLVSLGLLALFWAVNQWILIPQEVAAAGSEVTYPYLLNSALLLFTVCYGLELLRIRRKGLPYAPLLTFNKVQALKVIVLLALIWVWSMALEWLGFSLSTMFFLACTLMLYGERSAKKILLTSILFPVGVSILFLLLNSSLPHGIIESWLTPIFVK